MNDSGIIFLAEGVRQYFADFQVQAIVAPVGLTYRSFQLNQQNPGGGSRIVFIPGEFDGTSLKPRKYGDLGPPLEHDPRGAKVTDLHGPINPRTLLQWKRPITLSIWAAPKPGQANNEQAQIDETERLFEMTVRACHTVQAADLEWASVTAVTPPLENPFGQELLVVVSQKGPLRDITLETTQPAPNLVRLNVS